MTKAQLRESMLAARREQIARLIRREKRRGELALGGAFYSEASAESVAWSRKWVNPKKAYPLTRPIGLSILDLWATAVHLFIEAITPTSPRQAARDRDQHRRLSH